MNEILLCIYDIIASRGDTSMRTSSSRSLIIDVERLGKDIVHLSHLLFRIP